MLDWLKRRKKTRRLPRPALRRDTRSHLTPPPRETTPPTDAEIYERSRNEAHMAAVARSMNARLHGSRIWQTRTIDDDNPHEWGSDRSSPSYYHEHDW